MTTPWPEPDSPSMAAPSIHFTRALIVTPPAAPPRATSTDRESGGYHSSTEPRVLPRIWLKVSVVCSAWPAALELAATVRTRNRRKEEALREAHPSESELGERQVGARYRFPR